MKHWALVLAICGTAFGVYGSAGNSSTSGSSVSTSGSGDSPQNPVPALPAQLATLVKAALDEASGESGRHHGWERAQAFYAARGFQPAWWSGNRREAARVLVERMEAAAADGLPLAHYRVETMKMYLADAPGPLVDAIRGDVHLTATLLRFAADLAYGIGNADSAREADVLQLLDAARDRQSATAAVALLEPPHPEYGQLRRALRDYRAIEDRGGWAAIPDDTVLRLEDETADAGKGRSAGDTSGSAAVTALCDRLAATGELGPQGGSERRCGFETGAAPSYNETLERALRAFQARHGLAVDGIVGPNTVRALNVPVEDRITQLAINMDRWRRLPEELGSPHVLVNVAGFHLRVRENGRAALSMRVVAGDPETPTPVMSDEISYLDFRPYWNVPRSITENELLPKILENRAYLRSERFQIVDGWSDPPDVVAPSSVDWRSAAAGQFPYRLRQLPGPNNALGLVKFMFPNDYSVYLHDTPATHRFEARRRAFSHGCVRVEDPVALAEFLLRDHEEDWSRGAVQAAMHGGERQVVRLPEPVPVHLTYFTAWVEDEVVQFRADLYGRDAEDLGARRTSSE